MTWFSRHITLYWPSLRLRSKAAFTALRSVFCVFTTVTFGVDGVSGTACLLFQQIKQIELMNSAQFALLFKNQLRLFIGI